MFKKSPKEIIVDEIKESEEKLVSEVEEIVGKQEFQNFKAFAFKNSMTDMAVAFILGAAFTKVVSSVSDNIFMPFLNYIMDHSEKNWQSMTYTPTLGLTFEIGKFIGNFVDFMLTAIILYIVYQKIIKGIFEDKPEITCITTRDCPYCFNKIDYRCKKCPFCTSKLKVIK